ncbi:MAG: hypothetical protein PHF20_10580 [Halothiobacillaceae bacterium]|nr:hypothetical protein [Halothiobacillaceae bacterium]
MNNLPPNLEYCDELARYIEHASCAVSVLGDLMEAAPEEFFNGTSAGQSIGFLLQTLGDGMMQRSMDGYAYVRRNRDAGPEKTTALPATE